MIDHFLTSVVFCGLQDWDTGNWSKVTSCGIGTF